MIHIQLGPPIRYINSSTLVIIPFHIAVDKATLPMQLTSPAQAVVDTPPASSRVISGLTAGPGVYCI